jgi:hypothetical protein
MEMRTAGGPTVTGHTHHQVNRLLIRPASGHQTGGLTAKALLAWQVFSAVLAGSAS